MLAFLALVAVGAGAAAQTAQAQLFNDSKKGRSSDTLFNGGTTRKKAPAFMQPAAPSPSYSKAQKTTTPGGNNGFNSTRSGGTSISAQDQAIMAAAEERRRRGEAIVEASMNDYNQKLEAYYAEKAKNQGQGGDPSTMREDRRFGTMVPDPAAAGSAPATVYDKHRNDGNAATPTRLFNSTR
jgi:hypothetical protein